MEKTIAFDVGSPCLFNGIDARVVKVDGSFRIIEWDMPDGTTSDYEVPLSWLEQIRDEE